MELKSFDQRVEELLTFMSLGEERKRQYVPLRAFGVKNGLMYWDEAEPFDRDASLGEALLTDKGEGKYFRDCRLSDVFPCDVTTLSEVRDDTSDDPNAILPDCFGLSRVRSLTLKDVRGIFSARYAVEKANAIVYADGTYAGARAYFGSNTGMHPWVHYNYPGLVANLSKRDREQESRAVQASLGLAFARDYDWYVLLGYENFPRLRFPTDPLGAREAFRLRDIPNGMSRRAALRHWVSAHWRTIRNKHTDDTREIPVVEHLRGRQDFTWNGLRCSIVPSPFDQRKAEQLQRKG